MSGLYPRLANSPAIFLALAILFTICYQITFDEQYGVLPDCVCWMVLYILFTQLSLWNLTDELATSNPGLPKAEANEPSTCASWVVAGGIACSSWLSGGFDIFPIYVRDLSSCTSGNRRYRLTHATSRSFHPS